MIKKILLGLILIAVLTGLYLYTPDKSVEDLKEKYADTFSEFVEVQGMDVHYRVEGQGMPLLLLHGTASSLHTWDEWTRLLTRDFKIVRLDLPAFGLTGPRPDRDYRISTYVEFLDEFMDKIGIDSFHLAGNSLGGGIAFVYAANHPDKVGKLILLDPSGFPYKEQPRIFQLAQNPIFAAAIKKVTPKSLIRQNIEEVYANDNMVTDLLVNRYYDMLIRKGNRQAFVDRTKIPYENDQDLLPSIEEPTLIMWGAEDVWIPVANAQKFNELIPDSRVIIYDNVGHVPMEEHPLKTARDALDFLK